MSSGPQSALALENKVAYLFGFLQRRLTLAILLAAILAVSGVILRPLLPVDETRYLTVAWEMFNTGNWLVPHLNGEPYSHKPPLLFWLINLAWLATGSDSEFAARMAPTFFLPLAVLLTHRLAYKVASKREADTAAIILMGLATFCVYSSLVMFDTMLACAALVAVIGLVDAAQGKPMKGFLLFGLSIGFGVLAKGPAVLIHVLPAALLAPLWVSRPQRWYLWYVSILAGIVLGALIGLAWAIPAAKSGGPEYANMILWGQTAGRVVNSFDHARPFWFYLAILPLLLFPWILSRNLWARLIRMGQGEGFDRIDRLPWIVALGSLFLFSFVSGKQIHYLIPAMPFGAIILARAFREQANQRLQEPGFAILMLLLAAFTISLSIFPALPERLHFTLNPWISALFLVLAFICWHLRRDIFSVAAVSTAGIFLAVHLAGFMGAFAQFDLGWVGRQLQSHPNTPVAYRGRYQGQIGYLGRLQRPVIVLDKGAAAIWLRDHPDGILISPDPDLDESSSIRTPNLSRPYRHGTLSVWFPSM